MILALALLGQILLADVTAGSGVDYRNLSGDPEKRFIVSSLGSGAGLLDYDQDGDLDLYLVNGAPLSGREPGEGLPNQLYRNDGGFRFTEVTEAAGVGDTGWGFGVAVGDFDNDGFPDLYVANLGPNAFYRNRGDGTFVRLPDAAGADHPVFSTSVAAFDGDGDGFLDVFVLGYTRDRIADLPPPGAGASCVWFSLPVFCGPAGLLPEKDGFFRNRGDGTFEDATEAFGFDAAESAYGLGVVAADLDGDRDADLYVANDSVPNHLWINEGGSFREEGLIAGTAYNVDGLAQAGMGVDAGDFDGDGQLDLFVTNFSHDTNTAYRNMGGGFFEDSTTRNALRTPGWFWLGWGTRFTDLDSDGRLDLFVANGHVYPTAAEAGSNTRYAMPNQIFRNEDRGVFVEVAWDGGLRSSRGAAFGDLDGDGRPDVVVVNVDDRATLLQNRSEQRGAMLRLVGVRAPRDGTGSRTRFLSGGAMRIRESRRSGSYLSSNDPRLHLPGEAGSVEIEWASGASETLGEIPTGMLVVREGAGGVSPR